MISPVNFFAANKLSTRLRNHRTLFADIKYKNHK